jgi:hypothetical protein
MYDKPVIFLAISSLVVILIYGSYTVHAYAEPVFSEESCTDTRPDATYSCCYQIYDIEGPAIEIKATYCKECTFYPDREEDVCTEPKKESLDEPVTPPSPPSGPSVVPGEGALSQDGGGGGILQQQQQADEGTQQPPIIGEAEPLPPDIPPKQPEVPEAQEEQQSGETGSADNSNN